MGFDAIIRSAITVANSVTTSLQATVTHRAWIGEDGYRKPTYAAAVELTAVVEHKPRLIQRGEDRELVQAIVLTFVTPIAAHGANGRQEPIDMRDKITLPDGKTGRIVEVRGTVDPSTSLPYMVEVVMAEAR